MRDHQSHDVLLTCVDCHRKSNLEDLQLRQVLAAECDAPIGTDEDVKVTDDFKLKKVRSAGRALAKNRDSIPQNRVRELEQVLRDFYQVETVDDEIIQRGANLMSG